MLHTVAILANTRSSMGPAGEIDGDGDEPPGDIDGDGEVPLVVRRRGRPRAIRQDCIPEVVPFALCYLVASAAKHALGHGDEPHVDEARWWAGEAALAGMVLIRWAHHANADVRTVPESSSSYCLHAQAQVRGLMSEFVCYEALEYFRPSHWPIVRQLIVSSLRRLAIAAEWRLAAS